jgi:arylsulfatase A
VLMASVALAGERSPHARGETQTQPNILLILVDDLGWADVGCYGSKFHETPHIDRLAEEGMQFTDAYAASAVCSPTRTSILTGKYPSRLGITRATPQVSLPLGEVTIAEALKAAGYRTAHFGKWHLQAHDGHGKSHFPQAQGFDLNVGGHRSGGPSSYFYPYRSEKRPHNDVPDLDGGQVGEFLTDRLTDEAIAFIREDREVPFLAHLWYYGVHTPIQAKKEKIGKYEAKAAAMGLVGEPSRQAAERGGATHAAVQNHPVYAAMVESVDENIGRLLQALEDEGMKENTVVILTSDNGGLSNGDVTSNLPLRGGKAWIYEGGIRVPLVIKWPGKTDAAEPCVVPVISTDFYPTMLQIAGLELRPELHLDGVSLVPLLGGQVAELDRNALFFHLPVRHRLNTMGPCGAVRKGDYKLIQRFEDMASPELYNLRRDIGERHDLANERPEMVVELTECLESWRRRTGSEVNTQ